MKTNNNKPKQNPIPHDGYAVLGEVQFSFRIVPISLQTANIFVEKHHRHHKKTQGHKFSIGLKNNDNLIGVAICGRPVSRMIDDGTILEVTRLCTYGSCNTEDVVTVINNKANPDAGDDAVVYDPTYTLRAANPGSKVTGLWSLIGGRVS